MEILFIIIGFVLGSISVFIFFKKRLEELKYFKAEELELFDSEPIRKSSLSPEEDAIIDISGFRRVPLKTDPEKLNMIYEKEWIIINFAYDESGFEHNLDVPESTRKRYMAIIRERINNGQTVKIPNGVLQSDLFFPIFQKGEARIYSKEEKRDIKYLLSGIKHHEFGTTGAAAVGYYCLPNGRVLFDQTVAHFSRMHHSKK